MRVLLLLLLLMMNSMLELACLTRVHELSMYDDHEIENDWVKGPDDALYVEAMKYYRAFFGIRNPPSPLAGEHYYNFSIGTSSIFVLDSVSTAVRHLVAELDAPEKICRS